MAESTTTPVAEDGTTQQTASIEPSGKPTEAKTFTQEQVNRMIQERLARAKSEPPADYDELKAKAARLDELDDAQKTELERITDAVTKARSEAADWKSRYDELNAQREREQAVRTAATTYGVDVDVLMRMGGDVDENARFLQAKDAARPKFGDMRDGGSHQVPEESLEEALSKARNPTERIRIREEFNARKRK